MLSLELQDAGFDFSVLTSFQQRLVDHKVSETLFKHLLGLFNQAGLLKSRGRQRTDSTTIWGLLRHLNRLELILETLQVTLNELVATYPAWLTPLMETDWLERYSRQSEEYHLPKGETARQELAH